MALTPTIRSTESGSLVVSNTLTPELKLPLAGAFALVKLPTPYTYNSQVGALVATNFLTGTTHVSDVGALVVGRGRIENPRLSAWGYTLDGHDYYVLRLGDSKTLVYDITTEQWSWFASNDLNIWRVNTGFNWWTSGPNAAGYGSNVVVGDDTYGLIWFLDPETGLDQNPVSGFADTTFERVATGQMISRDRQFVPIYSVALTASLGDPALVANTVTLSYSDDQGRTYVVADDTKTAISGDYAQGFEWRSLGMIRAPGRLFQIADNGAFKRIDGLDVNFMQG